MPILTTFLMRLPVWPFQAPARTRVGKFGHLVEHGMHLRHDVLAVHRDRRPLRRTQRDMQNGAVFGDVDLLAAEHGVDARAKPRLVRQIDKQLQSLAGDAVFRVVEEDAGRLGGQPRAARGVCREQVSQVNIAKFFAMRFKGQPRRAFLLGPRGPRVLDCRHSKRPILFRLVETFVVDRKVQDVRQSYSRNRSRRRYRMFLPCRFDFLRESPLRPRLDLQFINPRFANCSAYSKYILSLISLINSL